MRDGDGGIPAGYQLDRGQDVYLELASLLHNVLPESLRCVLMQWRVLLQLTRVDILDGQKAHGCLREARTYVQRRVLYITVYYDYFNHNHISFYTTFFIYHQLFMIHNHSHNSNNKNSSSSSTSNNINNTHANTHANTKAHQGQMLMLMLILRMTRMILFM